MNNANGMYNNSNNLSQFNNVSNGFDHISEQGLNDSSAGFNNIGQGAGGINPGSLDLSQFQNPQHRAQLDGLNRNQSPAYHNSAFHVPPVVPAKRPRPGEDTGHSSSNNNGPIGHNANNGVGVSPQPNPSSRSQTPQQGPAFPPQGFPNMQNANNPFNTSGMYQHLQNQGQQGMPSPTAQNQNFRPQPTGPPRIQSNSPHAMSGTNTHFGNSNQMHTTSASRMATPQNAAMMQNMSPMGNNNQFMMQPGFPGQFAGMGVQNHAQMPPNMQVPEQYRMRLLQAQQQAQQHMQQTQMQQSQRATGGPPPMPQGPQGFNATGNSQQQPRNNMTAQAQVFLKNLNGWCAQNNIALDPDPRICGRPVTWFSLFAMVTKSGVLNGPPEIKNNWMRMAGMLAAHLGIPESQHQQAIIQAKDLFEKNLMQYFIHYSAMAQKRMMTQRQPQRNSLGGGQPLQTSPPAQAQAFPRGPQHSTSSPGNVHQQGQQPGGPGISPMPSSGQAPGPAHTNGTASPAKSQQPGRSPATHQRPNDDSRKASVNQTQGMPSATSRGAEAPQSSHAMDSRPATAQAAAETHASTEWTPNKHSLERYGGIDVSVAGRMGMDTQRFRPGVAVISELGVVDLHDLSKRLQSGFPSEVTPALDQLVILTAEVNRIQLRIDDCGGDLLDSLIDCGEQQLDTLSKAAIYHDEKTQMPTISGLAKTVRCCDQEVHQRTLLGDEDYALEHAAERLLAIFTILRNFSFLHENHPTLVQTSVMTFLCHVLRLLPTEGFFLRSARNTIDVMKDVVILLSNVAQVLLLPTKEHASIILDFLLAFLPSEPSIRGSDKDRRIRFVPYQPVQHQYLPFAVDGLAKLLARDHPNRSILRSVFITDGGRGGDLLTRAFALAISVVPERSTQVVQTQMLARIASARVSILIQGILAADILASLIPDSGKGLARCWLESDDGWVVNLLHVVLQLAAEPPPPNPQQIPQQRRSSHGHPEDPGFGIVAQHGLSMVQRLVDRSMKQDDGFTDISTAGWPSLQDAVLDALSAPYFDPVGLRYLCNLAKCVR